MADVEIPSETPGAGQGEAQPEVVCETLYIQNLNEKIKVDGMVTADLLGRPRSHIHRSIESISTGPVQVIRRSA